MIARCPSAVRILHRPNTIFRLSGLGHCAPSLQHHHGGGLPAPAHSRTFSSSSPTASTGQTQDVRGSGPLWSSKRWKPFDDLAAHLDEIAPRFEINAGQIEILREPKDFYDVLKVRWFQTSFVFRESWCWTSGLFHFYRSDFDLATSSKSEKARVGTMGITSSIQ